MAGGKPDLSDFDRIERVKGDHYNKPCAVGLAFAKLKGANLEAFKAALEADYKPSVIQAWCEDRGVRVHRSAVTAHRDGVCMCARRADG